MNSNPLSKTTQITTCATLRQKPAQQRRKHYMEEKSSSGKNAKARASTTSPVQKYATSPGATFYRYKKRITDLENGISLPARARSGKTSQKGEPEKQFVTQVRQQSPTYGKKEIAIILKRDYAISLFVSTAGRIITCLLAAGAIQKSSVAPTAKRRQIRDGYAQRKPFKDYSKAEVGEDVQIDQTTITINGRTYKLFQAWDRCSKILFSYLYCDAKSATARRLPLQMIKTIPFKIKSIQVDGGLEFRGKFEQACAEQNVPFFVIPPREPKHNGGVECANRMIKEVPSAVRNPAQKHHRHTTRTPKSHRQVKQLRISSKPCRTHANAVHSKLLSKQQKVSQYG